jgi:CHAT domain-containing protein
MRLGTVGLNKQLRDSFTSKSSGPYRRLAYLLTVEGRLAESERVLLLLKESELNEFVQRLGDPVAIGEPLRWTASEQDFADRLQKLAGELSQQWATIAGLRGRIERNELTYDSPEWKSAEAVLQRLYEKQLATLANLSDRFAKQAKDAKTELLKTALRDRSKLEDLQDNLRSPEFSALRLPTTAAITWLPDARGLTILVATADSIRMIQVPVSEEQLNQATSELRNAIQDRGDYGVPARLLYQGLIQPAEEQLAKEPGSHVVKHLMLNAIGSLRDIPFAALVNPESKPGNPEHLVERYSLSTITAQSVSNIDRAPIIGWQIAGLGASRSAPAFGNIALPAVREELCGIVHDNACSGAITGQRYEDNKFNNDELRHLLGPGNKDERATVVHLATHYSVAKSLLLLGSSEALPLDDLVRMDLHLNRYDLITLSACDSAVGGAGVESLAGLLQEHDAKAVLATLWSVQDEGTAKLMVQFYRDRGEQRKGTKAKALQMAQLALLRGDVKSDDAHIDLRQPYFWAPFVLMGNWL